MRGNRLAVQHTRGEASLAGECDESESDQEKRDAARPGDERAENERTENQHPADQVFRDKPDPVRKRGRTCHDGAGFDFRLRVVSHFTHLKPL